MMETIFIISVSPLPCLVYLSICIYVLAKMRGKWDDCDSTASKVVKEILILFSLIALCFLSGLPYALFKEGNGIVTVIDRIVLKLYVMSSLMPCLLVRRYVYRDRLWLSLYAPAVFIPALVIVTDIMAMTGHGGLSMIVLFRCSVVVVMFIFGLLIYVYKTYGPAFVEEGKSEYIKDILTLLLALSVYNFLMLLYAFKLHAVLDYYLLISGFAVLHVWILLSFVRQGHLLSSCRTCLCVIEDDGRSTVCREERMEAGRTVSGTSGPAWDDSSMPLKERLVNYFESEKPYLSKNISMQEVAMRLFTNKSYLSKTINMEMNKNFRELVNYYRVKEAMRLFSEDMDISMNDLRNMSGFNNNASFTSAFKLNTGCTPGEWCRDMKSRMQEEERRNSDEKR